ncbi:hypothetical protein BC941DRAFT_65454 [Chlamydoabsidia padenii]|nr:hypothetical protein BC941DRAFT_65454 [Chlamydoabsidia padenii]
MFLFKIKKKKRSNDELVDQEESTKNDDIYVKDDHLLNIKLPDDFSSIVLPQLIGYEQDENGNTINSSTTIPNDDNGHHRHSTPICREGWYPVTRFIGSESSRGTLVDTTNITAASLVQANKRLSVSFSSSYGDTLTSHSKEYSDNDHSVCSDSLNDPSLPASPISNPDSACMNHSTAPVPHLRKNRPKFNRNHPRFTNTVVHSINLMNESSTVQAKSTPDSLSSSSSLATRCISPVTCDDNAMITHNKMEKPIKTITKPSIESALLKPRQWKRSSVDGDSVSSMIPRRPPPIKKTPSVEKTPGRKFQSKKQSLTINGSGSRIPVRAQTMKV